MSSPVKDIEMALLAASNEIPNGTRPAIENRYDFLILCTCLSKEDK